MAEKIPWPALGLQTEAHSIEVSNCTLLLKAEELKAVLKEAERLRTEKIPWPALGLQTEAHSIEVSNCTLLLCGDPLTPGRPKQPHHTHCPNLTPLPHSRP